MQDQEIKVKYYLNDLPGMEQRLQTLGATLLHPHIYENNLRFENADGDLERGYRVLRLRQDERVRLTYKGPGANQDGARVRTEIEFDVSDFRAAQAFLEALDFHVAMMYEKFRTTYQLGGLEVVLDELPYGNFLEIEGPDPASVQAMSTRLGLDWQRRADDSYTSLFERLRGHFGLKFRDLTFDNFNSIMVRPSDLLLQPADVA